MFFHNSVCQANTREEIGNAAEVPEKKNIMGKNVFNWDLKTAQDKFAMGKMTV